MGHNDLTFFTNELDRDLYSRFSNILKSNTNMLQKVKILVKWLHLLKM